MSENTVVLAYSGGLDTYADNCGLQIVSFDPEILEMYEKLGIPLAEQKFLAGVAVDAVLDSVSVATTYKGKLAEQGIIFCAISEAVRRCPELVRQYLGSVVPASDNFFAALNAAVFSDGSFVFVPKGVRCPMDQVSAGVRFGPGKV